MSEAGSIKAQVYVPGKSGGRLQLHLTYEKVCDWIKLQELDDYTTQGLIQLAAGYPTQALPMFRKNFNVMIQRVRTKRQQEQNAAYNAAALLAQEEGRPENPINPLGVDPIVDEVLETDAETMEEKQVMDDWMEE